MAKEKLNGYLRLLPWILAVGGWIYTLGGQSVTLKANGKDDAEAHPKIQDNRENIISLRSDYNHLNKRLEENIIEQKAILDEQRAINTQIIEVLRTR